MSTRACCRSTMSLKNTIKGKLGVPVDKLFEKIDSYNIFNYFIPGAIIFEFLSIFGALPRITDILSRLVIYYFTGLTASRIGSMLFDKVFETLGWIEKSDYQKYVSACQKDKKIELFVEVANMYRTIYVGAIACLIATFFSKTIVDTNLDMQVVRLALASSAILFFLSYRKQSNYVNERVSIQS